MNNTFARRNCALVLVIAAVSTVRLASANTGLWIGNPGVSANTNWSDNANWNNSAGGNLGYTNNDLVFGGTGSSGIAGDINNVVDTSSSSLSLAFTNGPGQFYTTLIPAGITLTNINGLTVGGKSESGGTPYTTAVNMTGGGTFLQLGTPFTVINFGTNASTSLATLDLSGLDYFVYTNSAGTMNIANATSGNRFGGLFLLAAISNNVTVNTINFFQNNASNAGNGNNSGIRFGAGTNVINVGTFNVVGGKNSGTVTFQGASGGLRLRGVNGNTDDTSRSTITVAVRTSTGTGTTTGNLSLNGHPVDIKAGTMTVGQDSQSGGNAANATVTFDTGILDATTINMGIAGNAAVISSTGTLTVGANGMLIIGSGGMSMVNLIAGAAATGNLNVDGGTVQVNGNIRKTTLGGTANITVNAGKLSLGATNTIGSIATNIDNLTLSDAILTLPALNSGSPVAVGTLTVSGTTDTINIFSVPGTASFPIQYPLITYTALNGSFDFMLGTLPGNYQGYISNNAAGFSVDLVITNSLVKSDTWRGNVNGNWNTSTLNWVASGGPTNYGQGDFVTFDDTLTGTSSVNLTTSLSPAAVAVNNSLSNYVFGGSGKITGTTALTKQGAGSLILTETGGDDFSGGIVVNSGTLILDNTNSAIAGGLTINGGKVQIGNNDASGALPSGSLTDNGALVFNRTDNITVATAISGTGTLTQDGSAKLTLTGVNGYSGGTTVANGTLALSGSGTISNSSAVFVGNATLDVSALSQQTAVKNLTVSNATIGVAANDAGWAPIAATSLTMVGPTNHISVVSFPPIASYPVSFTIIQAASPAGAANFGVASLPAGYVANVSQSLDQTAVLLVVTSGPVGTRPSVLWTGTDVPNLNTNWSDRLNWQLPGAPVAGDTVVFNTNGAQSASALSTLGGGISALLPENINNIVDADFALSVLIYTNLGGTYHNTFINSGRTLSVTNSGGLTVGALDSGSGAQQAFATISGANGTLSLSNTNANMQVWVGSGSVGGSQAILDLSALNNFNATVSRLLVGATIGNVVNRPSGILYLGKTNTITAAFQTTTIENGTATGNAGIVIADCNQNAGSQSSIWMGRANTIKTDTIAIGRQKANARLLFNPIYANVAPYPFVNFQGFTSSQLSVFNVGDSVGNTGTTSLTADADLTGGFVTATVDIMNIGRASSGGTSGTTVGSLEFDAGTISVNSLNIGLQPSAAKVGQGTVGVGSNTVIGAVATLVVRGNLSLGTTPPGTATSTTAGTLNITNGIVLANNILAGTNSASAINVYGGRLAVTNVAGTLDTPLGTLSLLPLGTPDSASTVLQLAAKATPAVTVNTLNLDGQTTTTNVIDILSAPPAAGAELPLIRYGTINLVNGATFNVGLRTLPAGYTGYITNDTAQSMVALVLTTAPHASPSITSAVLQSGPTLVISGTNGYKNGTYYVLASTNVALPLASWTPILTNSFDVNGNFSSSTLLDPAKPQQYFLLQLP